MDRNLLRSGNRLLAQCVKTDASLDLWLILKVERLLLKEWYVETPEEDPLILGLFR